MKLLKYLVSIPFAICVVFLRILGKCTGLSYVQISVVFNLWIQGSVLLLSGWLPFVKGLMCPYQSHEGVWWLIMLCTLCYGLLYLTAFVLMLRHYRLPFDRTFDKCVSDLQHIACLWHCSYYAVNIIISVILFLLLLCFNIHVACLVTSIL